MTTKLKLHFLLISALWSVPALAQTAAFSYRGHLTAAGVAANSPHDMEFKLFDTAGVGAGAQQGDARSQAAVPVANGVFTVTLDFGAAVFDGSPRFLEIGVRPAGGAGPHATLAPRQQVVSVPYAIHSLTAGTATSAATATALVDGAGVRSLNNLRDDVTLAAGANVTITPSGKTLTIAAISPPSLWSAGANNNAYYTAGNVGIGTVTPAAGIRLDVKGSTLLEPGGSGGGFIQFHTPDTETGMTISGSGTKRADVRFDGSTLKLVAANAAGPPPAANGLAITTSGNVGIGTASPAAGVRLDVKGSTLLEPGGSGGGFIQFHTPDTETGMTISGSGNKRADIRFDGSTLKLVAANAAGPPSSVNGIAITTAGSVGIGTTAPGAKLHVQSSQATTAVYGLATGAGAAAVYGKATGAGGVAVVAVSNEGAAIQAVGDATQSHDKGGFVKAMLNVDGFGRIIRCYNGVSGSSTDGCGFAASGGSGVYRITFPFPVSGRFVSVTPAYAPNYDAGDRTRNRGANYRFPSDNDRVIDVFTFRADEPDDTNASDFMLIVF